FPMLLTTTKLWRSRCNRWQHRLLNFDYSRLLLLIFLKQVPNKNCPYPRVTFPRSFSLIHSPEIGSNWTPTLLAANMFSSHNPVFFLQNNIKFSMLPLTLKAMPTHGLNLSFKNMSNELQYQSNLPHSKSIQTRSPECTETRISLSLKPRKSMIITK